MINPSIHSHGSKFSDGDPLYLDATNNRLGINTTSPSHALNVAVSAGDDGIVLQKAGTANDIFRVSMDGTVDQGELFLYDNSGVPAGTVVFAIRAGTNPSYINSPGGFGIGSTTPGSILEIQGDGGNDKQLRLASGSSSTYWDIGRNFQTGHFEITEDSGDTYFLIDKDNGNVGIGNTAPEAKLEINATSAASIFLRSSDLNAAESSRIRFSEELATYIGGFIHYDGSANTFNIGVHPTSDETIGNDINAISIARAGGNVGIGVAAPASPLHVEGAIRIKRTDVDAHSTIGMDGNFQFAASSGYNFTFHSDQTNVAGTEIVRFRSTGQVGIGKAVPASELAIANGTSSTAIELYETWTTDSNYERGILKFDSGYFVIGTDDAGAGTASGLQFQTDSTLRLAIDNAGLSTFSGAVTVGSDGAGHDVTFHSSTASRALQWDASAKKLKLDDLTTFSVGSSDDLQVYHTSHSYIENTTNDLYISNLATGADTIFKCDDDSGTSTELMRLDGSASSVNIPDSVKLKLGTSGDLQIYSDNLNTIIDSFNLQNMLFRQHFLDGDMTFQCDNGSGGLATYYYLDGSEGVNRFSKPIHIGAGTSSPAALLDILDSQTLSGSIMSATVQTTATLTATSLQSGGYKIQNYFNLTGTGGGFSNTAHQQVLTTVSSTGTGTYLKNHISRVHTTGSGQINSVGHYNVHTELGGTGTITNWVGYAVAHPNLSAFENSGHTITNTYGLYIGDIVDGTQTNTPYGVYQASTDMLNYFGGKVGIGTASPSANADLTIGGGALCMAETTTPTADANFGKVYTKSDNKLYFQDGAGTEHEIAFA